MYRHIYSLLFDVGERAFTALIARVTLGNRFFTTRGPLRSCGASADCFVACCIVYRAIYHAPLGRPISQRGMYSVNESRQRGLSEALKFVRSASMQSHCVRESPAVTECRCNGVANNPGNESHLSSSSSIVEVRQARERVGKKRTAKGTRDEQDGWALPNRNERPSLAVGKRMVAGRADE